MATHSETINGLHSCQSKNEPQVGQIKTFVIINNPATETKKAWTKIKSALPDNGGQPYRILSVEPTGFIDKYNNHGFNLEVEASSSQPTAFAKARETMQQGEPEREYDDNRLPPPEIEREYAASEVHTVDGVTEARKHLMQSANLYNLCVDAVDKAIAPWMPEVARTSEQFQAAVASLFIEASKEQWWSGKIVKPSLVDSMPTIPIKK